MIRYTISDPYIILLLSELVRGAHGVMDHHLYCNYFINVYICVSPLYLFHKDKRE